MTAVCRPTTENDFDTNILLDSLSCVDVIRSFGLDASAEGRLKYAADHGIRGEPFSPDWKDEIRRHVLRRNDAVQWYAPPWWFPFLAIIPPQLQQLVTNESRIYVSVFLLSVLWVGLIWL